MRQPTKRAATLLLSILAAAAAFALVHAAPSRASRFDTLPSVVLWAWERPEDLRFLKPQLAAVAFLAETITLPSTSKPPVIQTRLQPLRVPPEIPLIAVVRIENPPGRTSQAAASLTPEFRSRLAMEISRAQFMPAVRGIQIDFDATTSEHDFYSALLEDIRRQIRPDVQLSITALASWCIGDSWLDALPYGTIDEAVPMLFRMGADSANVANFLRTHRAFAVAACNKSLGLSTDETFSRSILTGQSSNAFASRSDKRIYIFTPHPWTVYDANSILQELHP